MSVIIFSFSDCHKYYYGINCENYCYGCNYGDCNSLGICNQGCNPRFTGQRCDSKYHLISIFFVCSIYIYLKYDNYDKKTAVIWLIKRSYIFYGATVVFQRLRNLSEMNTKISHRETYMYDSPLRILPWENSLMD